VSRKLQLSGRKFGRLLVQEDSGGRSQGKVLWTCLCECGKTVFVVGSKLVNGHTQSCGCRHIETAIANAKLATKARTTHGHCWEDGYTSTYSSWHAMLQRCTNPNHNRYSFYGGSGVSVCDGWKHFSEFLHDMGERPEGTTLGRFGDVGNYNKENCAWMTPAEQGAERRKRNQGRI
jgi:hypothetical protein